MGGGGVVSFEITDDTYIGDLWVYLGSPSEPVQVTLTADNADVAEIIIPTDFAAGSTFDFIAINNGRFIGTGGDGGDGGDDNGAQGTQGNGGNSGGNAISSDTFAVNIDIDDGFLLGGGGGGGGGSFDDLGASGTPGGGGGGGQGWGDASGGAAGSPTGSPLAVAGTAGSQTAAGGGGNGGTVLTNDGGDGGEYGYGGTYGLFANPSAGQTSSAGNGGYGGRAGAAFFPVNLATPTFNGAKSEATLRSESRLKGEIDGVVNLSDIVEVADIITTGSETVGFDFLADSGGTLRRVNSQQGNTDLTGSWYSGKSITASDYEIRTVIGTSAGAWDTTPGGWVEGTWQAISVSRNWEIADTDTGGRAAAVFQIRRAGDTGGGDEGTMASGFLNARIEFEP